MIICDISLLLRIKAGSHFVLNLTQVWRRSLGGGGSDSMNSTGYPECEQPIRAREKHYPPFKYVLKRVIMHCRHVFIAHVVTLPNGPHKKKMMTVIQRDGAMAKRPVWLPRC